MKRTLDIEELDFLEEHLYDEKLYKYYELDKPVKEYVLKARRLPYIDILDCIDFYYENNVNANDYINFISNKYNSNNEEILNRIREVNNINVYRKNIINKKLMKKNS